MGRRLPSLLYYCLIAALATFTGYACDRDITGSAEHMEPRFEPQAAVVARSPTSPHFKHMRTSIIDYRIHYLKEPQKSAEYNWTAARYDKVIGGLGLLNAYKSRNPSIRHYVYDKLWFTPVADGGAAESWLSKNGYNVENAYLHAAGTRKTKANRVTAQQFKGRWYWYYNLKDPGYRAYRARQAQANMARNAQGHRSDSFFFDSNSNNTMKKYVPARTLEYGSYSAYMADFQTLAAAQRAAVPANHVLLNQAQYFTKADEMVSAGVAGGVMTEYGNTPYGRTRWVEIDRLVANGVVVHMSTGVSPGSKHKPRNDMNRGNYNSIAERVLMYEYASYLMVVNPARMDAIYFEPYGLNWSEPFTVAWLPAYEVDIGLARAPRSVLRSGTDPSGQQYSVTQRQFSNNVLVLIRGQKGTKYGEQTAVNVSLPGGSWRMVRANGTLAGSTSSVKIRNSEALLFMK